MNPRHTEKLQHSYREQLIKAGVEPQRAVQAAGRMTHEDLRLVSEIWEEWGLVARSVEIHEERMRSPLNSAVELPDAS